MGTSPISGSFPRKAEASCMNCLSRSSGRGHGVVSDSRQREHASGSDDGHASMFGPGIAGDVSLEKLRLDLTDQVDGPDGSGRPPSGSTVTANFFIRGNSPIFLISMRAFWPASRPKHPGTDRFVIDGPELIHLAVRERW